MQLPLLLTFLLLLRKAHACIHFQAIAPYDDEQPYLASITHNGILTCWISMTYAHHMLIQKHTPVLRKQDESSREVGMEWEFQPWEFECLDGYEGRAMIGT